MLIYTKLAAPKQPKRRSRGGCTYCKEKKKKCDEARPKCTRCAEHKVECAYEGAKPRQRRRRESAPLAVPGSPSGLHLACRRLSGTSHYSHDLDYFMRRDEADGGVVPHYFDEPVFSPSEGTYDNFSIAAFSATDLLDSHPVDDISEDGQSTISTVVVSRSRSLHPDLAMIAPSPVGSPLLDFFTPTFAEFTDRQNRRALLDHFCNVLSHLIVFREETGNPFQQLVLPLTRGDSPVTYAIFALACAHLEYRGVENAEKSLYFHNMAIRGVAQLIEHSSKVSRNEILAAIMLLVYYECLVQNSHSNIVAGHLKGALTVMGTVPDPSDTTSVFLERAFRFYDVITALSNGTPPLSAAPSPGCLLPLPPLGAPTGSPLCNVDTLLGMATTLWPIIHRLAGLRALKTELDNAVRTNGAPSKIAVLRTEFESTAQAIEAALLQWQPQLIPGCLSADIDSRPPPVEILPGDDQLGDNAQPGDDDPLGDEQPDETHADGTGHPAPTANNNNNNDHPDATPATEQVQPNTANSRLFSIHHNALAYRHASLVYLYRTVLNHPRHHPTIQTHTNAALTHCVRTVTHGGPMSALLWPLFVAACEAMSEEDRGLAEWAFVEVEKRQGMRNIGRAWVIVREVWRRGDEDGECGKGDGEGTDAGFGGGELWREVSREMGVSIVFG